MVPESAKQGNPLGQLNLAAFYESGQGMRKDLAEALKWLQAAADHGEGNARYHLAEMYETGTGVPKDRITALMWFILAREAGSHDFMRELHPNLQSGSFAFYRHPAKKDYEEAKRRAQIWNEQHLCQ